MASVSDRSHDASERLKVIPLDSQGILLEERNDPVLQLDRAVDGVHRYRTFGSFQPYSSTPEERSKRFERRDMVEMLRNLKRGLDMPSRRRSR